LVKIIKDIFYKLVPCKFILRNGNDKNIVYLTFDDGPYNEHTKRIFEGLCKHKVLATFFVNGDAVPKYADLLIKIHKSGSLIGNHSFSHRRPSRYNFFKTFKEIKETNLIIESVIQCPCCFYRPPFGFISLPGLIYCAVRRMTVVMWSYESMDSFVDSYEEIEKTLKNIKGGDILLFHNDSRLTADHIEEIITIIKNKNLKFGLISDIVGHKSL
jgi:peptidoglycan-N-acetylglucosamine deacetylase